MVIVGSGGRLGAALARRWRERHRVVTYDRKAMDLMSAWQIEDHLRAVNFDTLVNCAALTRLESCEEHPDQAWQTNSRAPAQMAAICHEMGARMLHVSTDYVYDGTSPGLKSETAPLHPLGEYAKSKAAGESAVLAVNPQFLIARVSWVFGPDRPSFVDSILERAQKNPRVEGIADKFSAPSYSHDLADMLERLLLAPEAHGIFNICNTGSCSWQEFGQTALDIASELGWKCKTNRVEPLALAEMKNFLCERPRHTAMDVTKFSHTTGFTPRPWQEALREYLETYYARR